ncbi:MAG: Holliday junction branch migration protein RuvA [Patescibacteria group bacterium]|jgi:Holliday junction DNA helicase RuvA
MIAHLSGVIRHISDKRIILDTQGVGYQVCVLPSLIEEYAVGDRLDIFTHLNVREDLMELFGFLTVEELEIFKKLLHVTTVGPKTAMSILSKSSVEKLIELITAGDAGALEEVPGIGKKTAERLVIELKAAFEKKERGKKKAQPTAEDVNALVALGYTIQQARSALTEVGGTVKDVDQRVRAALKILGGQAVRGE